MPRYMVTITYRIGVEALDEEEAEREAYETIDTYALEPKVIVEDDE